MLLQIKHKFGYSNISTNHIIMKKLIQKTLLILTIGLFSATASQAQMANGRIVPNFTADDINGVSHTLYDYLDDGYNVILDVSATWCGPCWGFHNTNKMKDIYINHGPAGMPGVSPNTTNTTMVFFIEGDGQTGMADLQGTTNSSQGDWIAGTPYPIIDNAQIANDLEIAYFPTLYRICANRRIELISTQLSIAAMINATACPVATTANNPALIYYTGESEFCGTVSPSLMMQNFGNETLTSCTITATSGGSTLGTLNWSGSLTKYEASEVTIPGVNLTSSAAVNFAITSPNDVASDDQLNVDFNRRVAPGQTVTVEIVTDAYGQETRWELRSNAGTVLSSGGPYNNLTAIGTTTQTPVTTTLPAGNECYSLRILDSFGDGMCCDYGQGSYTLKVGSTVVLTGGEFSSNVDNRPFFAESSANTSNVNLNNVNIFPNPTEGFMNISFTLPAPSDVQVEVFNAIGQRIMNNSFGKLGSGQHFNVTDLSGYEAGIYTVTLIVNGERSSHRVSVAK